MRLYFVRHGESEANRLREFSNRGYKHGLTEEGKRQAATLAQNLRTVAISRIFASPLMRAVQTAEILTQALGKGYTITDALREYDCGVLEGKSDPASWRLYQDVWQDWLQRQNWERRIEGGESLLDIKARFVPFVQALISQYGPTEEHIVLVGHGGTYRCMMPLILNNVDSTFAETHAITHTGCIIAEWQAGQLICVEWCGTGL